MQPSPPTFAITTLGCKANQYDGQAVRERIAALGWIEIPFRERADLYIVNTCTVTATTDQKCRKRIRQAHRRNPNAQLIVTGCVARTAPDPFRTMAGVSAVLTREQMVHVDRFLADGVEPDPGDLFDLSISGFAGHSRAFLKVQDGCSAGCAYCIVPKARGPGRSRPLEAVAAEARRLIRAGFQEIVLTGIHLGHYGRDTGGRPGLSDVARAVLAVPGVARLRLSSVEAVEISDELIHLAASDDRFCPHFHLPLQSGDDAVLARMRRRYRVGDFLATLDRVRAALPQPSFTTDVMVGFPGETDAEFENTLRVCRQAGFSRIHIFPFSPRPGTPAADMPDRVARETVREREACLKQLATELALAYKRRFLGREVFPLVEHRRDRETGLLTGWTAHYVKTIFDGPEECMGRIVRVMVKEAALDRLLGTRV